MIDVAKMETDLEVARGELDEVWRLLTTAGVPEVNPSTNTPLHILFRVRIALGMEEAPK